jgi:hypothetical protein
MSDDPYAQLAKPVSDPYASIAKPAGNNTDASSPSLLQSALGVGKDLVKGVGKGALKTLDSADDWSRAHLPAFMTNTGMGFGAPADLAAEHAREMPHNTAQTIGKGAEQVGEFMLPTGIEEAGAKAGGALLGKGGAVAGKMLGSALHSGAINKEQGGDFSTGAAGGIAGTGIGEGIKAMAPGLAEAALKVRGNDRLYGRTVGDAIINDTKGVYPESVAASAKSKIAELTPQLEQQAADASSAGNRGSLLPARQGVADTISKHTLNRAAGSVAELQPLEQQLATDSTTGLPLAQSQTPTGLLQLKRGLNSDFIQNWKPDQPPGLRSSAKTAYRALNDEFHNAAPGTQELDQRVSSLIPVVKRAEAADANAGVGQRVLGRLAAHTGAATLGGLGAAGGYREGGIPGAIAGGLTGIVAPEMMSSPTAQMIMARTMNSAVPKLIAPATTALTLQANRKDVAQ